MVTHSDDERDDLADRARTDRIALGICLGALFIICAVAGALMLREAERLDRQAAPTSCPKVTT